MLPFLRTTPLRSLRLLRRLPTSTPTTTAMRFQSTTTTTAGTAAPKPKTGGVKGTIYGFLAGSTISGIAAYVYLLEEFKRGSELVAEDVDALRASVLRIEAYVRSVEDKLAEEQAARRKK